MAVIADARRLSNRQPAVARVDRVMIGPESRSQRGPQMSPMPDSTLADPERLIADLQRQLAECRASATRHSPSRPATAEVLQVINGSPSDLESVFQAIVEKGAHAVRRRLWQFAAVGWREVPWRRDARFFGSNGRRAAAGPGIQSPVPTLAGRRAYRSLHRFGANRRSSDWAPAGSRSVASRTILFVALRKEDALLGKSLPPAGKCVPLPKVRSLSSKISPRLD